MGRMNRIDEDDGLVGAHSIEQILVLIDEGLLFVVVEAAPHRLRLAIVKAQTMRQGNQTRAAVAQSICPPHPGSDLPNASGTMGVDPIAMRLIHVFADNASYHKADIVKAWLAQAGRKIRPHFLPPYCPHLDPIERLWALMHENVTRNRDYKTFAEFRREVIKFLRHTVPKQWESFCDRITDNLRVIHRADFRVLA
jgi:DDE superfamily endonuclease